MSQPRPERKRILRHFMEGNVASYFFYAFLAFLAFAPCLVAGKSYDSDDLWNFFGPLRAFTRNEFASGIFPLWNPYLLGGQPFFADLQNMLFYPVNYLTLSFSVSYGFGVFFFLHAFGAACGAHQWLRSLNLSTNACRVGALLFAFSNFFWLEVIHPPVLAAFAWLPWLFASIERFTQNPKPKNAFFVGITFCLLFLCGSLQVTVGAFYAAAAYLLFGFWKNKTLKSISPKTSKPWILFLFLLWGLLPLLGQLIPTLEFSSRTDRLLPDATYEQSNSHFALAPSTLYQFLLPRIGLKPDETIDQVIQEPTSDSQANPFEANLGYLGVLLPLLVLMAYQDKEKKNALFFSGLGLFSILISLGKFSPFHRWVCAILPGFSLIRVPFRFIYLYILAAVALAALGFDQWEKTTIDQKKKQTSLPWGIAYALFVFILALINPTQTRWEIFSLILAGAAWTLGQVNPARRKTCSFLFSIALVLPLFLTGWSDFKTENASNFKYEKNSSSLPQIGRQLGPFRLVFDNAHMPYPRKRGGRVEFTPYPQNAAAALSIKNNGGYNPLILKAKRDLQALPLTALTHLSAVGGLVSGVNHGDIPGFKLTPLPPFYFYQTSGPLFYVFAPSALEIIPDPEKRLERLTRPDYDPYRSTLLSAPLPSEITQAISHQPAQIQYQIDQDEPNHQSYSVELSRNSLTVFSEMMFPGWKAFVDGQPAPIFTADHVLRSVYLAAGKHEVDFRFEPFWWRPIQAGVILWVLITLGYILLNRKIISRKNRA